MKRIIFSFILLYLQLTSLFSNPLNILIGIDDAYTTIENIKYELVAHETNNKSVGERQGFKLKVVKYSLNDLKVETFQYNWFRGTTVKNIKSILIFDSEIKIGDDLSEIEVLLIDNEIKIDRYNGNLFAIPLLPEDYSHSIYQLRIQFNNEDKINSIRINDVDSIYNPDTFGSNNIFGDWIWLNFHGSHCILQMFENSTYKIEMVDDGTILSEGIWEFFVLDSYVPAIRFTKTNLNSYWILESWNTSVELMEDASLMLGLPLSGNFYLNNETINLYFEAWQANQQNNNGE